MTSLSGTDQLDHTQDADALRRPLGALLVEAGFVDEEQLAEALRDGTETGERLGEVVVRRGWATEDDVARLLAEQWGLGYVERASIWFDASALARLSREDAQQLEALPVRVEDDRVLVAVAEPTEQRLAELRRVVGEDTVVVVVPRSALDAGIRSELLTSRRPATEPPRARPETSDLSELADRAREIADFLAGRAVATDEYEQRIERLEAELAESRAAAAEATTQLAAVRQLLEVSKPPA